MIDRFENLEISPKGFDETVAALRVDAQTFQDEVKENIDPAREDSVRQQANEWLNQQGSQEILTEWVNDIVHFMDDGKFGNGVTGHDRRHLAKDVTAALRTIEAEGVLGFDALTLIPSFLHDAGRLVEGRYKDVLPFDVTSPHHPLFSFAIAQHFRSKPYFKKIPAAITDHILYAILTHADNNPKTHMTIMLQSSDREQLVGSEGIARHMIVQASLYDRRLVHPDLSVRADTLDNKRPDEMDCFHGIEFFVRNLNPQPTTQTQQHTDCFKALGAAFLYIAAPEGIRRQLFAPELREYEGVSDIPVSAKKILPLSMWQATKKEVTQWEVPKTKADLNTCLDFLLNAPGNPADEGACQKFTKHFGHLSMPDRERFCEGMAYAQSVRDRCDKDDLKLLSRYTSDKTYIGVIARWAKESLFGAHTSFRPAPKQTLRGATYDT